MSVIVEKATLLTVETSEGRLCVSLGEYGSEVRVDDGKSMASMCVEPADAELAQLAREILARLGTPEERQRYGGQK